MSLHITPVPAFDDNYIWLLRHNGHTVCIDPGDAAPVAAYLKAHGLTPRQIWLTHHHADHTGGVPALLAQYPQCRVYGHPAFAEAAQAVGEGSTLDFGGLRVEVWSVPGHTDSHLAYLLTDASGRRHVFCGDTLFSAGCGRVFTGTVGQLEHSLQRFAALPDDTLFYPAHEYTAANLRFAAHIEPGNADIQAAANNLSRPSLPVTLAHERRINPFLRTGQPAVAARAAELCSSSLSGESAVFAALRELKNGF